MHYLAPAGGASAHITVMVRWVTSACLLISLVAACDDDGGFGGLSEAIFDPDVVHRVEVTVQPQYLDRLADDRDNRVPCDLVIDGVAIPGAGIRQKGGIGSLSDLDGKPGFSVRFDEFDPSLRFMGRRKLILNNAIQDESLLNEHLGYEVYRRAGLPAPHTAHGVVSLNGESYGVYVFKEAIDEQFLVRIFGNPSGNLYEGPDRPNDFMRDVERMDLKRETKESRSRDDLIALVELLEGTPDAQWPERAAEALDLDGAITGYAIDAVVDHWDGYAFNSTNYYFDNDPFSGRFAFIPHGMDQLFHDVRRDVMRRPEGELTRRIRELPELEARYVSELHAVFGGAFDPEALIARAERVEATLHAFRDREPELPQAVERDLERFDRNLEGVRQALRERRAYLADRLP